MFTVTSSAFAAGLRPWSTEECYTDSLCKTGNSQATDQTQCSNRDDGRLPSQNDFELIAS